MDEVVVDHMELAEKVNEVLKLFGNTPNSPNASLPNTHSVTLFALFTGLSKPR